MPIWHLPAVIQVRYIVLSTTTTELGEGNVRSLGPCILTLLLLASFGAPVSAEQQVGLLRKHHPWGTFEPGAWKRVRTVTETFEASGRMSSTTDAKTTLKEVVPDGVTLQIQVNVEVGGKRFDAPPEAIKQGFDNELANSGAIVQELGPGQVTIQGRKIDCRIQQWERTDVTGKTTSKVFYSETVEPYIFRRETLKTDAEGKSRSETVYEVIAMDVPYSVLGEILNTAHIKIVHKNADGTTTTLARVSMDVPGGVICHTLKEIDNQGCLLRRASLELVDYGLTPERERGLFHRRPSRVRKWQRGGN